MKIPILMKNTLFHMEYLYYIYIYVYHIPWNETRIFPYQGSSTPLFSIPRINPQTIFQWLCYIISYDFEHTKNLRGRLFSCPLLLSNLLAVLVPAKIRLDLRCSRIHLLTQKRPGGTGVVLIKNCYIIHWDFMGS